MIAATMKTPNIRESGDKSSNPQAFWYCPCGGIADTRQDGNLRCPCPECGGVSLVAHQSRAATVDSDQTPASTQKFFDFAEAFRLIDEVDDQIGAFSEEWQSLTDLREFMERQQESVGGSGAVEGTQE